MITELEQWRADKFKLVVTAEGPKLVRKDEIEPDYKQEPVKPKKNGNGCVIIYWGRNKPNSL